MTAPCRVCRESIDDLSIEDQLRHELECLQTLARRMFAADEAYGCGFYGEAAWCQAYEQLELAVQYERRRRL